MIEDKAKRKIRARGFTILRHVKTIEEGETIIKDIVEKCHTFESKNKSIIEGCIQLEKSEKSAYHVQGYIKFDSTVRLSFVQKLIEHKCNYQPINMKVLNASKKSGDFYFTKTETRVGRNYSLVKEDVEIGDLPECMQMKKTRFEEHLWGEIEKTRKRNFLIVEDHSYGLGKSTWAIKNDLLGRVYYVSVEHGVKDIIEMIVSSYKGKGRVIGDKRVIEEEVIFVIDLPATCTFIHKKDISKYIQKGDATDDWRKYMKLCESISNGLLTDRRYETKKVFFSNHKVVMFTNSYIPKLQDRGIAPDRLRVWKPNPEYYDNFKIKEQGGVGRMNKDNEEKEV